MNGRVSKRGLTRLEAKGAQRVDREAGVIYGVSMMTVGPAVGHGFNCDLETVQTITKLGQAKKMGAKARFGHPHMCHDAVGTFLGRFRDFRDDGEQSRADLHIDPAAYGTPHGDLATYVMNLAESDPAAFGASLVIAGDTVHPKTGEKMPRGPMSNDGETPEDMEADDPPMPVFRPTELHACDVVDEPAANAGGLLSRYTDSVQLSAGATHLLDQLTQDPEAVDKVIGVLTRYSSKGATNMATKTAQTPDPGTEVQASSPDDSATRVELAQLRAELAAERQAREELAAERAVEKHLLSLANARTAFDAAVVLGKLDPVEAEWALGEYDADGNAVLCDDGETPKNLGYAVTDPAGFALHVELRRKTSLARPAGHTGVRVDLAPKVSAQAAWVAAIERQADVEQSRDKSLSRDAAKGRAQAWCLANEFDKYTAYREERKAVKGRAPSTEGVN